MGVSRPADDILERVHQAWLACGQNANQAARELSMPVSTLKDYLKYYSQQDRKDVIEFPDIPRGMLSRSDLVRQKAEAYDLAIKRYTAQKWRTIKIYDDKPVGICWFGDPHVDDNGCDWPSLNRDLETVRTTPGMFGANIGDTGNNWPGKLAHLWAEQDTSRDTAYELTMYLLEGDPPHTPNWAGGQGVIWLLWLLGNHDLWTEFAQWMRRAGTSVVPMDDWQAQFILEFPNGRQVRIDARHDFPGNSQWNSLHGPQKAAHTKSEANLYICGHKHNWALHQEELGSRAFTYWLARARGYKTIDAHADKFGYTCQSSGASIVSVIDPNAESDSELITCFPDVPRAAKYLTFLRGDHDSD